MVVASLEHLLRTTQRSTPVYKLLAKALEQSRIVGTWRQGLQAYPTRHALWHLVCIRLPGELEEAQERGTRSEAVGGAAAPSAHSRELPKSLCWHQGSVFWGVFSNNLSMQVFKIAKPF